MQHRYEWRRGNRYRLLVDGPEFFPQMLDAIGHARDFVLFENYIVASGAVMGRFIEALTAAAKRGVAVSLVIDEYGSDSLEQADRRTLREAGCELNMFNPRSVRKLQRNLHRNHRKLVLVDGKVAFVGGYIITDGYDPPGQRSPGWHDTVVQVEGPCVRDWAAVFRRSRARVIDAPFPRDLPSPAAAGDAGLGRVTVSEPRHNEIERSLLARMDRAEHRVWLVTPYFVPSVRLRRALRGAAKRGLDVRLLLAGSHTDLPFIHEVNRRFYPGLLRHGVRIFEYRPECLHAKFALCDRWISLGSSNFDRWNFRWNLEANQEIVDEGLCSALEKLFWQDLGEATEYRRRRSVLGRI